MFTKHNFKELVAFGGTINKKDSTIIGVIGAMLLFLLWYAVTATEAISPKILPNPVAMLKTIPTLITDQHLFFNIGYTVVLNLLGYVLALTIALPLGFVIGIYPLPNALFKKYFEGLRYLPLPTVSGIFIAIFGLSFGMKAKFLAFGILIFTLPSVIQKITDLQNPSNEKDYIYIQSAKTMGMTNWQMFRYVYIPYVMDRVYGDIRSLVAISYTYVVIAECLNKEGGIGAAIQTLTRQSRTPEIYALLFIIVLIGISQDYLFKIMDPVLFKHHKQ